MGLYTSELEKELVLELAATEPFVAVAALQNALHPRGSMAESLRRLAEVVCVAGLDPRAPAKTLE